MADANGDLFGTTTYGGTSGDGTVFEIKKTAAGYASVPTTLVSFNNTDGQYPQEALIADANGDLFGTTEYGGAYGGGTVFEIKTTAAGYASAPTTLVSFDGADGEHPFDSLIINANGDLLGTTEAGNPSPGTVFEIKKTAAGYASAPTTLVSFNVIDGANPYAGLVADANGDLFGTTANDGTPGGQGTVFEIKKTAAGYAAAPTTLVVFDGLDGAEPQASLIVDANGDLFGTTAPDLQEGLPGGSPDGTVFEIKKTAAGYASAPTTLFTFNVADETDGLLPIAGLIADSNGDLFGTTEAGGAGLLFGTVFEITNSGFATKGSTAPSVTLSDILWRNSSTGGVELWSPNGSGGFDYESLGTVSTSWQIQGTGDFAGDGEDSILWRNSTTGDVELWSSNGSGAFSYDNLGAVDSSWQIAGTADFTGNGEDGIVWRNSSTGGVELWNPNGSGGFTYDSLGTVGTSWQIQGTGDFTGNGEDGIVWRNSSTGGVELWNANGSGGFSYDSLGTVGTSWQIQGTGDFTGNGEDGIVWRNSSTGGVELWNANGSGGFTYQDLGVVSSSWTIQGTGDFTGSGADSILWRNSSTGAVELWNPSGSGGFTYQDLGVVNTSWHTGTE